MSKLINCPRKRRPSALARSRVEGELAKLSPELADEELVSRLSSGDPDALRELMGRYQRPLYGYLFRLLGSAEDADDLFQETFLRVLKHSARFDSKRRFRPWLYAIASNLVRNAYRSRSYRVTVPIDRPDDDGYTLAARLAGRSRLPLDEAQRCEAQQIVNDAVGQLPDKGRAALVLYYYQGLSYEEVSVALEIPLGTVKSRIHNAMARLDKALSVREEML
jgi:RNA polymerase sigma-70 factor, ECF subfamily